MELDRYCQNQSAISAQDQAQLAAKRVLVVGCGGLGGYVLEFLGRLGVGQIRVVDGDLFEESNLNRQLLSSRMNLGRPKALAAQQRLQAINPLVQVEGLQVYLTEQNAPALLEGCHLVVDALDNIPDRLVLQEACAAAGIPLVHGALAGWWGQVCVVLPGEGWLSRIYEGAEDEQGSEKDLGALAFTAAAVAAVQAAEAAKLLLGKPGLRAELLQMDLLNNTVNKIAL